MNTVTGIISEVNNMGRAKGSNIVIAGSKYGAFDPVEAGIDTVNVGDEVSFSTKVNGQYVNIVKNTMRVISSGNAVSAPPPQATQSYSKGSSSGGFKGGKTFPIPTLDGQRSIIRQNSLAHAASVVNTFCEGCENDMDLQERVDNVLGIAAQFERFSAGDDIAEAAEQAMQQLGTSAQ